MKRLVINPMVGGAAAGGALGGLPAAVFNCHGMGGLIVGGIVVCVSMVIGAILPELSAHRMAGRAAKHQQWQLDRTRASEAKVRGELLTCNPYIEIARIRAGLSLDATSLPNGGQRKKTPDQT